MEWMAVAREIIWRRPTAKRMGKDLDDINTITQVGAKVTLDREPLGLVSHYLGPRSTTWGDVISVVVQVPLRSCRRQFDNLRRAYNYIEDQRSFQVHDGCGCEPSIPIISLSLLSPSRCP